MPFGRKKDATESKEFDVGPSIAETRTRSRKLIVAGVILAVCAGVGSFVLIQRAQQSATTVSTPKVAVIVATHTIPARQPLTAADVTLRDVPMDATNAQGTFTNANQVVGRISSVAILQGQLVTSNLFTFSADAGGVAILSPDESFGPDSPNWRAVSLTVPDDRAVGGMITAGEHVDVFVTTPVQVPQQVLDQGQFYSDKSTKVVYQDVPILAKSGSFYVIKVTEQAAEEIAHLQATGAASFSLALRPNVDTRQVDASKLGETTNTIIERYGLPIPQAYPRAGQPLPSQPPVGTPTPMPTTPAQAVGPTQSP